MTLTRFRLLGVAAAFVAILSTAAFAITSGTTGTEKRWQKSGLRVGALTMQNLTATAASNAATLNSSSGGIITTESLTTAAGATYTLTLTNDAIAAGDMVFASVQDGTSNAGTPAITTVAPAAGSVVIIVQNIHSSNAVNGTLKISFFVVKQSALDAD
jgi:hypothetical protein